MGIIRSIKNDGESHPTVDAVLECLRVSDPQEYLELCNRFDAQTRRVRDSERVEIVRKRRLLPDATYFHNSHTMVIFRVRDDRGYPIEDFDLTLIGEMDGRSGANFLPKGFFVDRQKNSRETGVLTYYFSYDAMIGAPPATDPDDPNNIVRPEMPGAEGLGLNIVARPDDGFVRYMPGALEVSKRVLQQFINPDQTVLVEIVLRRVVREGVFRLSRKLDPKSFRTQPPGEPIP